MKIPSSIMVCGQQWSIKLKDHLYDEGIEIRGLCEFDEKTIHIGVKAHKTRKSLEATFLHELFHAVLFENCLDQTDLDRNLHEIIVESISRFMINNFFIRFR